VELFLRKADALFQEDMRKNGAHRLFLNSETRKNYVQAPTKAQPQILARRKYYGAKERRNGLGSVASICASYSFAPALLRTAMICSLFFSAFPAALRAVVPPLLRALTFAPFSIIVND
jgi:hypothetical protein